MFQSDYKNFDFVFTSFIILFIVYMFYYICIEYKN